MGLFRYAGGGYMMSGICRDLKSARREKSSLVTAFLHIPVAGRHLRRDLRNLDKDQQAQVLIVRLQMSVLPPSLKGGSVEFRFHTPNKSHGSCHGGSSEGGQRAGLC